MEHLILFFPFPFLGSLLNQFSLFPPSYLHLTLYIRVFFSHLSSAFNIIACILVVVVVKYRCWLGEYYNA